MQEVEVYENPNKTQETVVKKPSRLWYLLPLLLGLIGGLVGYFELKTKDRKMAKRMVIVGLVITLIPVILIAAGAFFYYGVFTPSSFIGPTQKGFTQLQVLSPWQVTSQGDIIMNVQNRAGQTVLLNDVTVIKTQTENGKCILQIGGLSIEQGGTRRIKCNVGKVSGVPNSSYALGVKLNYSIDQQYFLSVGTITGVYQ